MTSLLPNNATSTEKAVETVLARATALPAPIAELWRPESCPALHLPYLAWALSVDEWDSGWPVERQRAVVAASIEIHRHKGTLWAVKRALEVAGYGDAQIIEQTADIRYDGTPARDGSVDRSETDHWAEYRVILSRPISIPQAQLARQIIGRAAPVRCHLKALDFVGAIHLYDARVPRDGSYTRGIA